MKDVPSVSSPSARWLSIGPRHYKAAMPLLIGAGTLYVCLESPTHWFRFQAFTLAFVGAVYLAILAGGGIRNAMATVASLLLVLAAIEAYGIVKYAGDRNINTPGYSVSREPLGWGPAHPGVFHHTKIDRSGRVLFRTAYTIDEQLHRRVQSGDGPTVAFFGGSPVFGIGVSDAETLPQLFADTIGRGMHVVNLAFSAYGPQQLLRGLETGVFDKSLNNSRLLVVLVSSDLVEWTACVPGYMARAPRYALVEGKPVFRGSCSQQWPFGLQALLMETSLYQMFVVPRLQGPTVPKIDLFVAILSQAATIVRERYNIPIAVLYLSNDEYLRASSVSNAQVMQRLRDGGMTVIDANLDPAAFPGQPLSIPGDGHPTATANRAWAERLREVVADLKAPER